MADIATSVLAWLKNKAKDSGRSYQLCLQLFCQEEFLRRLEKSQYAENLVLKGDEVFLRIVCVCIYRFTEHFVIYLATMLEHIADGAFTVVNGKGNTVFADCGFAEVVNIVFNVIDLYRHGGIKPA